MNVTLTLRLGDLSDGTDPEQVRIYVEQALRRSLDGDVATVTVDQADDTGMDECVGLDGEWLPHGRCDTCGAACDESGCPVNREHPVALDAYDWDRLSELVHEQASQLASNAINSGEQFEWLLVNGWTWNDIKSRLREMGSKV